MIIHVGYKKQSSSWKGEAKDVPEAHRDTVESAIDLYNEDRDRLLMDGAYNPYQSRTYVVRKADRASVVVHIQELQKPKGVRVC